MPQLDRIANDIEMRRWLPIPRAMPDEIVAECLHPYIPVEISRDDEGRCFVIYYARSYDISEFRRRVDRWEADNEREREEEWNVEHGAKWANKLAEMDLTEPDLW